MFFQHDLSRFTRPAASAAIPLLVLAVTGSGCGGETRPAQTEQHLLAVRTASDAQVVADTHKLMDALLHRTKGQYDEYRAGKRPDPPVVDILIISGGGDWGAFGAGFLKGWGRVPRTNPLARPDFVIVTGVSTGALIAPFAFLGDVASINLVEHLYRNPKPDWVKYRGWLYFLPSNISFAEVPGLEREVDAAFTMETARRIEEAGADGRVLMVNTTNIDDGSPRVFDLVAEARRGATVRQSRSHPQRDSGFGRHSRRLPFPHHRRRDVRRWRRYRKYHLRRTRFRERHAGSPMASGVSRHPDPQGPVLGAVQQSVPAAAPGDRSRSTARRHHASHGNQHAGRDDDGNSTPVLHRRELPPQMARRYGSAASPRSPAIGCPRSPGLSSQRP